MKDMKHEDVIGQILDKKKPVSFVSNDFETKQSRMSRLWVSWEYSIRGSSQKVRGGGRHRKISHSSGGKQTVFFFYYQKISAILSPPRFLTYFQQLDFRKIKSLLIAHQRAGHERTGYPAAAHQNVGLARSYRRAAMNNSVEKKFKRWENFWRRKSWGKKIHFFLLICWDGQIPSMEPH